MNVRPFPWAIAALILLSGCATMERRELGRAADATASPVLRKVGSVAELDQLLGSGHRLAALEDEQDRRRKCRQPRAERPAWLRCKGGRLDDDDSSVLETIEVTGSRLDPRDLITNNQEGGVDEGDFVKKSGDFLLVLRGGTLHVVRIARGDAAVLEHASSLRLADDDDEIWFDEILTFGPRILLLGFNYGEDQPVAELQLFTLDSQGGLQRDARFWLRSNDYFDGDNYGARLQGDNLLLSLNLPLELSGDMAWPEWSRRDVAVPAWTPLLEATDLYYPMLPGTFPNLHVVLQCPLSGLDGERLACRSTGFVASGDSELYVTARHAYLALGGLAPEAYRSRLMHPSDDSLPPDAWPLVRTVILRVPFAQAPAAVATVHGSVDQAFQFREDADGSLWVLALSGVHADEIETTRYGLYRLGPGDFSDFAGEPGPPRAVAEVPGAASTLRFGRDVVWFGEPKGWHQDEPTSGLAWALALEDGQLGSVQVGHSVQFLQPAEDAMLAIGLLPGGGSSVSLLAESPRPRRLDALAWPGYVTSESRSHAVNIGRLPGGPLLLGVPAWPDALISGEQWPDELASDLVYARIEGRTLSGAGALEMQDPEAPACEDCWDWYGNARSFLIGGRVFALSGSLLVEAAWRDGRVQPRARLALP
ncbi:beta-propeller domain-containing protein [Arenimonas aestuarii]